MSQSSPLLVIAAGGTGGHMFPAQALAEEMLGRGWRVNLSTDARGAYYAANFPDRVTREVVPSATFARGGVLQKAAVPLKIFGGVLRAWWAMRRARPVVVVGFGGYPAIPAMVAAILCGVPRIIHEQNGVMGRVNALFASRVNVIAAGTWPLHPAPEGNVVKTGNPVRAAVAALAGAPYIPPGEYPMKLLVIGGSQGARILSDVVPAAVAALPERLLRHLRVDHQARPEDMARVTAAYEAAGISAVVKPFFDDLPRRMSEAQLVISRAGASSVADLSTIGRPAILVPLASAAADHQTANARGLSQAGAAIVVPESRLNVASLAQQIDTILSQPQGAEQMARAALACGTPDATQRLATLVVELAVES